MDPESENRWEDEPHDNGGLLTISTDAIEVYMPERIAAATRELVYQKQCIQQQTKMARKDKQDKRKSVLAEQTLERLAVDADRLLVKLAKKETEQNGRADPLKKQQELERNKIEKEHGRAHFAKLKIFWLKVHQAVSECKKFRTFFFHVVFFEFNSSNLNEMDDYTLEVDNETEQKLEVARESPQTGVIVISIDCDMEIHSLIQALNEKLEPVLAEFKRRELRGDCQLEESLDTWICILFQAKFYLDQIALEALIQFLDEIHHQPFLRFIMIFKKIEETYLVPPRRSVMLYNLPIERFANYTYEFLNYLCCPDHDDEEAIQPIFHPEVVSQMLFEEYETFKPHLSWTVHKAMAFLNLQHSLKPAELRAYSDPEMASLYRLIKAGRLFIEQLMSEHLKRIMPQAEDLTNLIVENTLLFWLDPEESQTKSEGRIAESHTSQRSRIKLRDIVTHYVEYYSNFWDRVSKSCEQLSNLVLQGFRNCFQGKTPIEQENQLKILGISQRLQELKSKIKSYLRDKQGSNIEPEKELFKVRKVAAVDGGLKPRDKAERLQTVLNAGNKSGLSEVPPEDYPFYEFVESELVRLLQEVHKVTVADTIKHIENKCPGLVIRDDRLFNELLDPSFTEEYIRHLGRAAPQSSSSRKGNSADKKHNISEFAVKFLFELIAEGTYIFQVEDLLAPFSHRLGAFMASQGIKLHSAAEFVGQQMQNSAIPGETEVPIGMKLLFYYAVNILKRSGLVRDMSKSKRTMVKLFFEDTDLKNVYS